MGILTRMLKQVQKEEDNIRSVDMVEQINVFRGMEENRSKLRHDHLIVKIEKYNANMKKIDAPKIRVVKYKDKKGEMRICLWD